MKHIFLLLVLILCSKSVNAYSHSRDKNHLKKEKFTVVDGFYYEGNITYFEGSKAHEIETEWKE